MYNKRAILAVLMAITIVSLPSGRLSAAGDVSKRIDMTHILMRDIELPERSRAMAASGLSFADVDPDQPAREKQLGQKDLFWTKNVSSGNFEQITAILRSIGKHCYIYVADDQSVSSAAINKIQSKFDEVIYPTNTSHFGFEWKPGIDGDNRIYLLLSDIKDGYQNQNDGYVAGYFFAGDQMMQDEFPSHSKVRSNEKEIIYIDTYPCNPDAEDYMEIVAHEFQHMIHYNQDSKEETWVNEACSQIAPVLCGFTAPRHYKLFKDSADRSLNNWAQWDPMPDYGKVYLWNQYILDTLARRSIKPNVFFKALTGSKKVSLGGYIDAFNATGMNFSEVFTDFVITNRLNDKRLEDGRFSYQSAHLGKFRVAPVKEIKVFPAHEKESVSVWAADAYQADIANLKGNLKISFSGYRRHLGPTYPYFRLAIVLLDSSNRQKPRLSFMKLEANPADKNRLIGSVSVKADGTFDQLECIIIALAPEDVDDGKYMPASGFIYDLRFELNSPFAADSQAGLDMTQFVSKIRDANKTPSNETSVRIRENYAQQLMLSVRNDLEKGSFKTVDSFIEAATEHRFIAPFARDVSGILRFYQTLPESQAEDLRVRIEILDSF